MIAIVSLLVIIIIICFIIVRSRYEIGHFENVTVNIENSKIYSDKYKIIFISDFHNCNNKKYINKIIDEIYKENSDLILVGGDQIIARRGKYDLSGMELLKILSKKYTVLFANGNHEARLFNFKEKYNNGYILIEKFLNDNNIIFLKNSKLDLNNNISIYGLDIDQKFYSRFEKYEMYIEDINNKIGECDKTKYNILLAHNPKYHSAYNKWNADLILSGHYHGGIIGLPHGAGMFAGNAKLFEKECRGAFTDGNNTTIVSAGLGVHTIKLRLFNRPQLFTIILKHNIEKNL